MYKLNLELPDILPNADESGFGEANNNIYDALAERSIIQSNCVMEGTIDEIRSRRMALFLTEKPKTVEKEESEPLLPDEALTRREKGNRAAVCWRALQHLAKETGREALYSKPFKAHLMRPTEIKKHHAYFRLWTEIATMAVDIDAIATVKAFDIRLYTSAHPGYVDWEYGTKRGTMPQGTSVMMDTLMLYGYFNNLGPMQVRDHVTGKAKL